jgi:outer membrane protein OmpU
MKKLLLITTALVGVTMMSAPASAAVKLGLGGYFDGYGVFADNNELADVGGLPDTASQRNFDLRRDSEVFFTGATTLDNGLTIGINYELDLGGLTAGDSGNTATDEAYAYASGGWGRFNVGMEDGAAFLLQVSAPSADSNVDGMQTTIQAINSNDGGTAAAGGVFNMVTNGLGLRQLNILDYEHMSDPTGINDTDRFTYLTPKFNGFQAGVSFAPETGANTVGNNVAPMGLDSTTGAYENIWEGSARWDGEFQGLGIALGGGYSHAGLQADNAVDTLTAIAADEDDAPVVNDDLTTWNAGANLAWSGFSLGGNYQRQNTSAASVIEVVDGSTVFQLRNLDVNQTTWNVGLGYDNGPWHVGGSYLTTNIERDGHGVAADGGESAAIDADVHRYTVGGGYTFGPGMTFRGAVAWGEFDNSTAASDAGQAGDFAAVAADQNDFQQITIGTDIQF